MCDVVPVEIENNGKAYLVVEIGVKAGRKFLGRFKGTTFITHIKKSDHFMIKERGFCINHELLKKERMKRVKRIFVPYDGKRGFVVFESSPEEFLKVPISQYGGYEEQHCIKFKQMKKTVAFTRREITRMLYY